MINQTNVLPQTVVSTPGTIPLQSAVQSVVPTVSYQQVPGQLYQPQQQQVVSKTTVVPDYGTTQVVPVQTVQSQVPLASTVPIQSQPAYVTAQSQPKYRLWNMLVPAFQPEPQPVPVAQTVSIPEPVPQPVEIPAQTYEVPAQTYEAPAEPVYETTYEEPTTYTVPETTQYVDTTQYTTTATPNVRVIRRGSGITMNEQQNIINCAMNVYQSKMEPISNNTAKSIKRTLGGDWLVIVYPEGKPIDFNMTCVQGNDYLYFIMDSWAFQVCRLR